MAFFNYQRYKREDTLKDGSIAPEIVDGSDALANSGMTIGFRHMISGREVLFKAFMTGYTETFNSDWSTEQVYGRADGIHMFKSTSRKISIGLKLPAAGEGEAYENLSKVQTLVQFLYPAYVNVADASTIAQSPLLKMKLMNLAQRSNDVNVNTGQDAEALYDSFKSQAKSDLSEGLLGFLTSCTVNHNLETESGVMEIVKSNNSGNPGSGAVILPKLIELNLEYVVIHTHPLGWGGTDFSNEAFPYNTPGNADSDMEQFLEEFLSEPDPSRTPSEQPRAEDFLEAQAEAQDATPVLEDEVDTTQTEGVRFTPRSAEDLYNEATVVNRSPLLGALSGLEAMELTPFERRRLKRRG